MQRKPTLTITNNSGDVFTRTYNTDEEAGTLFNSTIYRSGREVVFTPSAGNWEYIWNKECWIN